MKFAAGLLIVASLCSVIRAQQTESTPGCWTNVDPAYDFFPNKVQPEHSKMWSIEYFNSYKLVKNLHVKETYLLYQCGTDAPTNVDGVNNTIQIPVSTIGIDQTPTIPFLEYLGLVDSIVAYTSDVSYVSSPCLLESIEEGNVVVVEDQDDFATETSETSTSNVREQLASTLALVSPFYTNSPFNETVKFSSYTETSNAAIFEWIKYVSTFFNLEQTANEVFQTTQDRWNCVTENAERVATDNPNKPKVVWMDYSDYCEAWSVGSCPNYYCEYATQCGATMYAPSEEEGQFNEKCQAVYFSTEQVLNFAKDADYWIYPNTNWDTVYEAMGTELDQINAVQNQQVYDVQASSLNAWFEQRYAEYFAVLQDYCSIVGTTRSFAGRSWFRNVFEEPVGTGLGECTEESRSNTILPAAQASECEDLSPLDFGTAGDDSGVNSRRAVSAAVLAIASIAFLWMEQ